MFKLKGSLLIVFTLLSASFSVLAQTGPKETPKGWHLMDKQDNGVYGISLNKAYDFIKSKNLKSKTVIVAVIDSGVDTTQEDLKPVLWHNPGEIPGNGIDDDHNGYVDDVYGWNFLGGKDGRNVEEDAGEGARVYHEFKEKWDGKNVDTSTLSPDDKYQYLMWKRAKDQIVGDTTDNGMELIFEKNVLKVTIKSDSTIMKAMGKSKYTGKELDDFKSDDPEAKRAKLILLSLFQGNNAMDDTNKDLVDGLSDYVNGKVKNAEARDKAPEPYRAEIVKDNYNDFNDRYYGNGDVTVSAKSAMHGTHVSGIIGADRTNNIGVKGIADNVKIMMLRVVPDGDEHDKDIALAIRYAVDNGARVINMSFGKSFSPEKKWIDEAVQYAESKNVLLVHSAGNDAKDLDTTFSYPTPVFLNGTKANNWISVGASGPYNTKDESLTADFSNYGKTTVDIFAPGVKMYSTLPGNDYGDLQGTSFSSPTVTGIAALIMEYFPDLTAQQVKMVILNSAQKPDGKVIDPGSGELVNMSDISTTGGLVNAYEAIKLASTMKGEKPKQPSSKKGF